MGAMLLPFGGLAFAYAFPSKHWGEPADKRAIQISHAGDWLAWCMLGMLIVMAGVTAAWVLRLRRLSQQPDPALVLMDELYQAELQTQGRRKNRQKSQEHGDDQTPTTPQNGTSPDGPPSSPQAWEKADDWWRRQ